MLRTGVISTLYFKDSDDYKSGILQAKEDGFDCLDFQLFADTDSEFHKMSEREFIERITELKDFANVNGIEFCEIHLPYGLDETSEEKRLSTIKYYERGIFGAKLLGAKYAVFHSMYPYGWVVDADKTEVERINREFVQRLLPFAEKYGVTLCIENLPWVENVGIPRVEDLKKFVDGFGSPYLKFCLDTGHAYLIKDDLYKDVKIFGKDLKVIHVHENRGQRDDFHAVPFTCEKHIDWDKFCLGLKEVGFDGDINLEINLPSEFMPREILVEYRKFVRKIARCIAEKVSTL